MTERKRRASFSRSAQRRHVATLDGKVAERESVLPEVVQEFRRCSGEGPGMSLGFTASSNFYGISAFEVVIAMNKLKRRTVPCVVGTILVAGAVPEGAPAAAAQPVQPALGSSDVDCLSLAVYYEARSETEAGQRAVAQVVLNRVADPAYPGDVCSVVFQGFERRTGCQFSFTCDGSMARLPEGRAWVRAREVATAALAGRSDASLGAVTHYHTTAIYPYWAPSLRRVTTIGAHIFYSRPQAATARPPVSFARVEQVVLGASDGDSEGMRASVAVSVQRGGAARAR